MGAAEWPAWVEGTCRCPATVQVETEKKKTQLGLVEQVSSQAVTTRVGDKQPSWHVRKEMLSWLVTLVLCAGKEVYVCQKNGKGSSREGSRTGSEGSKRVRTQTSSTVGPSGAPSHATN